MASDRCSSFKGPELTHSPIVLGDSGWYSASYRLILLISVLSVMITSSPDPSLADQPRSLLIVTIDTLRADFIGGYGHPHVHTPTIDRLLQQALCLTMVFAETPLTLPAHTSLMTGESVVNHGITGNLGYRVPDTMTTLAERCLVRGYRTAAFISGYPLKTQFGLQQGFELYDDHLEWVSQLGELPERRGYLTAAAACDWARAANLSERPYFVWIHLYDPHDPYLAKPLYLDPHYPLSSSEYAAEVSAVDRALELICNKFLTGPDQPLLVVVGDHGESLNEHGERTHGILLSDATLHVPCLLRDRAEPGERNKVWPELLSLAHLGSALTALVEGGALRPVLMERLRGAEVLPLVSLYPLHTYRWHSLKGLRGVDWKLVDDGEQLFFDLLLEPQELRAWASLPRLNNPELLQKVRELDIVGNPTRTQPDEEMLEQMASLGYLGGNLTSIKPTEALPKPRTQITLTPIIEQAVRDVRANRFEEARKALAAIYDRDSGNPVINNNLGLALLGLGLHDAAVPYLERAVVCDPTDARLQNNLGTGYKRVGKNQQARQAFEAAITSDPLFWPAYFNLGKLLWDQGLKSEAQPYLDKASEDAELRTLIDQF